MTDQQYPRFPFVLLYHELPPDCAAAGGRDSHWDLMVATDDSGPLRTWALESLPIFDRDAAFSISALSLPDHRRFYLEHEGVVSGDRGNVRRVQTGLAEWQTPTSGGECLWLLLNDRAWQATFRTEARRVEFVLLVT